MEDSFMKSPCKHCPFRNDVNPFLHPDRAEQIAYAALNPYSDFPCHKTTEYCEDDEGDSDMVRVDTSKECAGFLTLRAQAGERIPKGFEPAWELCYIDPYEMIEAYQTEWDEKRKIKTT